MATASSRRAFTSIRTILALTAAALLMSLVATEFASAASVSRQGGLIWFEAASGEKNNVRINGGENWGGSPSPNVITISDRVPITPFTGCARSYRNVPTEVTCGYGATDLLIGVFLLDGDDTVFSVQDMFAKLYFYGGAGNDLLQVSESQQSSSYLDGEAGNDNLWAGNAKYGDTLYGGDGNDTIHANNGFKDKIACDRPSAPVSGSDAVYADYSSIEGPASALYGCNSIYRRAPEW